MDIRSLFRRGRIINAFRRLDPRFRLSHSNLMVVSILFLILFIAFMVRMLPLRWGFHLSEFDPHAQYRLTKIMVDNGFLGWLDWTDAMRWYPNGYNVGRQYPGLPATAAFFYVVLEALGLSPSPMFTSNPLTVDPVFNLCIIFPVIMGTLACFVMYFLGKDFGGKAVGLFAALFLALNSSYIGRTSLGFFDNETVGIFGILLFIFFFLRSIEPERTTKNGLVHAIAAGASLGYVLASWGAARYPIGIALIFVFVVLLMRRYSSRLFLSYSTTFGVALFIAINIPRLGFGFLFETYVLAVAGIFLLLCLFEASRRIETFKKKTFFVLCFLAFFALSFLVLSWLEGIEPLSYKWWAVINPFGRIEAQGSGAQLVLSVQEQRPAAWGSFYYDLGVGAFFVLAGFFFTIQNPTNRNIFLCIFGLTSVYFAGSMVRLTLLMAPAFSILWALALVRLLRPFVTIMKEVPTISRRVRRLKTHVGREFSVALMAMMFLLLTLTFVLPAPLAVFPRALGHAYSPTTIAASSLPVKPAEPIPDWLDTLNWMRFNLPPSPPAGPTVIASWWDYGYWISIIGNRTTLADNSTSNSTQIGRIGRMFLSNETEAIKTLESFDATHVVVFTTFQSNGEDIGWGDEGKWRWMARIGGLTESDYGNVTEGAWTWNTKGQETVIYKLMTHGKEVTLQQTPTVQLEHFEKAYFSQIEGNPRNYGGVIPLVCVYKVNYD